MNKCCDEPTCTRSKPILLSRDIFTGNWFAVTDYDELPGGILYAKTQHGLGEIASKTLNEALGYSQRAGVGS